MDEQFAEYLWLERLGREQEKFQGKEAMELIEAAAIAIEYFSEDELERYAEEHNKKRVAV